MNDESGAQMNARLKSYENKKDHVASIKTKIKKGILISGPAASNQTTSILELKTRGFRTMSKQHVNAALTGYLRSMSLINSDEQVTNFNKAPDSLDVKVEKI